MAAVGSATPRLSTAPLRALTPASSLGFAFADWCEQIGHPLLPWQKECAIRAMETMEDGSYRFKTLMILVGRQSGKTTLLSLWSLWRMIEDGAKVVLGVAQNLDIAREAWMRSAEVLQDSLPSQMSKLTVANGKECLYLTGGKRYRVAAATRSAGRGLSIDMLIVDEVREQRNWDTWGAISKTVIARPTAQIVCISNAGDDESIVLNSLRATGLSGSDESVGLFEWSAPEGCALDDPEMWAMGLPALGHTIDERAVRTALATDPPAVFRTEILCQHVSSLSLALSQDGWALGADADGSVEPYRGRLDAGLDVSPDGVVVLAVAVATGEGVRVEPVASWETCVAARRELPSLLGKVAPRGLAWFPGGPANALAPLLQALPYNVPMTGQEVNQACAGFADLVAGGRVIHNADAFLDAQVASAGRKDVGDGWRFTRGAASCNALYAVAGATHLAMKGQARPSRRIVVL